MIRVFILLATLLAALFAVDRLKTMDGWISFQWGSYLIECSFMALGAIVLLWTLLLSALVVVIARIGMWRRVMKALSRARKAEHALKGLIDLTLAMGSKESTKAMSLAKRLRNVAPLKGVVALCQAELAHQQQSPLRAREQWLEALADEKTAPLALQQLLQEAKRAGNNQALWALLHQAEARQLADPLLEEILGALSNDENEHAAVKQWIDHWLAAHPHSALNNSWCKAYMEWSIARIEGDEAIMVARAEWLAEKRPNLVETALWLIAYYFSHNDPKKAKKWTLYLWKHHPHPSLVSTLIPFMATETIDKQKQMMERLWNTGNKGTTEAESLLAACLGLQRMELLHDIMKEENWPQDRIAQSFRGKMLVLWQHVQEQAPYTALPQQVQAWAEESYGQRS